LAKNIHEIRDPIHVFIKLDSDERRVLDSRPFQRLRYIHQLGLSYLVYPGATHKRFEHSLGVMELASRVFDVIANKDAITDEIRKMIPEVSSDNKLVYWRRVLRMSALCHDIGHLPFSHSAENELLPQGWDHEQLTMAIILSDEMRDIWSSMTPPLRPEDVAKLAVGKKKATDKEFSDWEAILSEIIVGDSFGVDRMDYLLRDSYHTGVTYGKFDHYRLIDTLRILISPGSTEPTLGVEEGGLQSSEALLFARYFIYSQVYYHPIRRIYDIHLKDFLKDWLCKGKFSTKIDAHLQITDNDVIVALLDAANDLKKPGHDAARRIVRREHFKVLYKRNPEDMAQNVEAGLLVYEAAKRRFGIENVRYDKYPEKGSAYDFPVKTRDGRTVSSFVMSEILQKVPVLVIEYVFVNPDMLKDAQQWLDDNRVNIIEQKGDNAL